MCTKHGKFCLGELFSHAVKLGEIAKGVVVAPWHGMEFFPVLNFYYVNELLYQKWNWWKTNEISAQKAFLKLPKAANEVEHHTI